MGKLEGLKPGRVFYYFEELTKIPRCSYDEKEVSDYIKSVGEELGLETIQDDVLNIIIRKPATDGYEDAEGIIIQGHMDIVCEKEKDSDHDFKSDPIDLQIDGDFISGNKTTLGSDNGIAVAMALAILEDDKLEHPDLEVLITTSEETEMDGALGLSKDILKGTRLLNVDSEEEGVLVTGSAGGELIKINLPIKYEEVCDYKGFNIVVGGLKGGHSGMEIHQARANSNKVLSSILKDIKELIDIRLVSITGGSKDNAIPRHSEAKVGVDSKEISKFEEEIENIKRKIVDKYKSEEPDINIEIKDEGAISKVIDGESLTSLIFLLDVIYTGVYSNLEDNKDIVESSSNLAIIDTKNDEIVIQVSIRSSSQDVMKDLRKKILEKIDKTNGKYEIGGEYPEWEYNPESSLRDIALETYKDMYNGEMESTVIHAGLECGVFLEKYPNLDIISFGPNIYDAHIPTERLSISSTERNYNYLIKLLENLRQ